MASELLIERRGPALVLTISDPATRNTLSPQVYTAGTEALQEAAADSALTGVVLRGDGAHFCAGGDLQRLAASRNGPPDQVRVNIDRFHAFVLAMRSCAKPVIAAVEGHAAGGGCSLVQPAATNSAAIPREPRFHFDIISFASVRGLDRFPIT